jgi:hypothetical protein
MPDVMNWSANLAVSRGPSVSMSASFVLAGYDVSTFTVDGGGGQVTMSVQPGQKADVRVLAITASRYDPADLTYDLGGLEDRVLDGAQLFTGAGMLGLFTQDPKDMTVTNRTPGPITVTVVVGRTAPS